MKSVNSFQYIKGIFSGMDLAIKNKQIPESYNIIAERIGEDPKDILFVSDNIKECLAADEANYGKVYLREKFDE